MKVSIIIPVYGVEQYLYKCVESVVNQTYKDIEIILVDDGSPDNCPKMCDEWAERDNRIRVIHKENGGQGTARNAALDKMTGDYVLFVDSDDYILHDMVEKLVAKTQNGKIDGVFCGMLLYDKIRMRKTRWYDIEKTVTAEQLIEAFLVDKKIFGGPMCKLFSAELFKNIRFPSFRANEDAFVLHHLLGKVNSAVLLNEWLYVMNLHEGSTEAKPFNINKMHLLDCDYNLKDYIHNHFPKYQEYADNKLLTDAIVLLKKLYQSGEEKRFKEQEEKLWSIVSQEYLSMLNKYPNNIKLAKIEQILRTPKVFKTQQRIKAKTKKVKTIIKKIISKRENKYG